MASTIPFPFAECYDPETVGSRWIEDVEALIEHYEAALAATDVADDDDQQHAFDTGRWEAFALSLSTLLGIDFQHVIDHHNGTRTEPTVYEAGTADDMSHGPERESNWVKLDADIAAAEAAAHAARRAVPPLPAPGDPDAVWHRHTASLAHLRAATHDLDAARSRRAAAAARQNAVEHEAAAN